jgi:hypothetical protein
MFVQVITATVDDREGVRRLGERWSTELRPGATGFLGATIGITDDGTLVNVARFESRDAAAANSERAEQGAWWSEVEKCLRGAATFRESEDVTIDQRGDLDSAGFVQVMQGRLHDVERARELGRDIGELLATERPDLLGDVMIIHPDGSFTDLAYFTSEAAAREGESKEPSAGMQAALEQMGQVWEVTEYLDLRDPSLF